MISRMLSLDELKEMLKPMKYMEHEFFLHTAYNQHEYAGAFDTCGNLKGLCDDPFNCGKYTDAPDYPMSEIPDNIREDMSYILEHPEEFRWWFVDAASQIAELEDLETSVQKVMTAIEDCVRHARK